MSESSSQKSVPLAGAVGKKCGMTHVFIEDGSAVPVTVIELYPLTVTHVKQKAKHGYTAVQVAYREAKAKHLTKAQQGVFNKIKQPLFRKLKEFRVQEADIAKFNVGDLIAHDFLNEEKKINVSGRSIGKGFAGRIKLHNFSRGPMSHGSKSHRLPGSIGPGTTPGRVYKGKRMAAHMGDNHVTVENLEVVQYMPEKRIVLVKGAVPGKTGAQVVLSPRKVIGQKK